MTSNVQTTSTDREDDSKPQTCSFRRRQCFIHQEASPRSASHHKAVICIKVEEKARKLSEREKRKHIDQHQEARTSAVLCLSTMSSTTSEVVEAQLTSLDDTDCYASVWSEILATNESSNKSTKYAWGGRGKGGRGLSRRTIQPRDVVVESVRLQYLQGDVCLEGATLKLLQGRVYSLIGKNGCGKSTLLQRMHAKKIPGFSSSWTTLYLPPELPEEYHGYSPIDVILAYHDELHKNSIIGTEARIAELEDQLNALDAEQEQDEMERLCEKLSALEEQLEFDLSDVEHQALEALHIFGIGDRNKKSCNALSRGQQKYVLLCVAMVCSFPNVLLLDEPTSGLDIFGLIQLRRIIESSTAIAVLVSHDVDLINDVATDIVLMENRELRYFPGNYDSYRLMKDQLGLHELRHSVALEKKKDRLTTTLQHIKEKPVSKRKGGAKKKAKALASQRKKLEWHAAEERAANANANVSILPAKKGLTAAQRLKLAESMKSVPDKTVQFM